MSRNWCNSQVLWNGSLKSSSWRQRRRWRLGTMVMTRHAHLLSRVGIPVTSRHAHLLSWVRTLVTSRHSPYIILGFSRLFHVLRVRIDKVHDHSIFVHSLCMFYEYMWYIWSMLNVMQRIYAYKICMYAQMPCLTLHVMYAMLKWLMWKVRP